MQFLCLLIVSILSPREAFRGLLAAAPTRGALTKSMELKDTLFEVLERDPNFSTFASLLSGVPELKVALGDSNIGATGNIFTVFAPNNAAFAKLDKQIMFNLGKRDNLPILRKVVRFHFVEAVLSRDDILELKELPTLALMPVSIKPVQGDNNFRLNEASVVRTLEACSNGIVHEVDALLSPFLLFRYLV